ncbi:hypothetical protein GJA_3487 [Janthinobacterium agaricidamnosum NBRC 102515 = DSM 9628]|uniref:Uncharacterized protein n=1 Tax=Janthinobacterium agaricidamnosum NBRC 102515 = DSM 9628 TaxID=1349767 RepID=W0V9S9_9BURK|nr:hypothetical protein GJA_3487 [Janthinobacterium agaricidamnosum NBRC 102515 = DSM 9628]
MAAGRAKPGPKPPHSGPAAAKHFNSIFSSVRYNTACYSE